MAWSWRKRKTIIPGVRLNFGKKGVSTTIGPRGASITLGPNGTYLNTSIPGTGLYNRKKIGGSANTSNMTNYSNFGCGTAMLIIASALLWVVLLLLIFASISVSWWVAPALLAITIATHLILYKRTHEIESTKHVATPHTSMTAVPSGQTATPTPTVSNKMTQEYFDDINTLVVLLMADYQKILQVRGIDQLLNSSGITFRMNGEDVTDTATKLNIMYWLDMTRCYYGLNNQIDLNNKSGFGLFDIIVRTLGGRINDMSDIDNVRTKYQSRVENVVRAMRDYIDSGAVSKEEFSVAKMLDGHPDLKKAYIIHLYRFASIAAKADNVVTEEEAEWLANIMKQSDSSSSHIDDASNIQEDQPKPSAPKATKNISTTSAMNELKNLIGLESVKTEVETLANFIKVQQARAEKGIKTASVSYHCVFTGNPGTGKTTVARILAKIYKKLGVVSKGHLVETDRAGLVAEYVGQTAVKTNKIIDSALDGVLFIDEAYSLVQGGQNDFGKEAIATLLKRMEDDRDRLIVIIAGYSNEMKDFIDANPGLQSRFNRYIEFPDYSAEDLLKIFESQATKCEYKITDEACQKLKAYFEEQVAHKDKNFGNGRFVRNVFEKTTERQANRLAREVSLTSDKLVEILPEDLPLK